MCYKCTFTDKGHVSYDWLAVTDNQCLRRWQFQANTVPYQWLMYNEHKKNFPRERWDHHIISVHLAEMIFVMHCSRVCSLGEIWSREVWIACVSHCVTSWLVNRALWCLRSSLDTPLHNALEATHNHVEQRAFPAIAHPPQSKLLYITH